MTRLIDADALDWERIEHEHGARHEAVVDCEQMVDNAPTIDPVRHGRWIDSGEGWVKCSVCHAWDYYDGFDYCPNCGAKMDGDADD